MAGIGGFVGKLATDMNPVAIELNKIWKSNK